MIGQSIGPYEILAELGRGGMGEVYRARDARLNRDVALKILPPQVSHDPDRLARFEREAQVLAALNHPNIAAIYGIEDSSPVRALVLELVDGLTLADRLAAGPVPVAEALAIARAVADALAFAHDAGVIHRDLKPANIKVRDDGTVKVLDFGLAKALTGDSSASSTSTMNSPTLTARATEIGMIIGTAAYMAPEQARGKTVDRRADLWAFGVVLYEMLTGRRAFEGPEVSDVLAAVLRDTPPLDALPADVPPSVKRLLRRTLEKDRARRLDSMTAARLELDEADHAEPVMAAPGSVVAGSRWRAPVLVGSALIAGAAMAALLVWRVMSPEPLSIQRFSVMPTSEAPIGVETNHNDVGITPDGSRLIYFSRTGEGSRINQFVSRPLESFTPIALKLGETARSVFLSPDGERVVFQSGQPNGAGATLNKAPLAGGAPTVLCPIPGNLRGASWRGESIVFATVDRSTGLQRVASSGGAATTLTTPAVKDGELDHLWPEQLPDGRHVLFVVAKASGGYDIALWSLESKTWRTIIKDASFPRYSPTGHILYGSAGVLHAVPFDVNRLEVAGDPVQVAPGVVMKESGAVDFALSGNGTLVYLPGEPEGGGWTLAWRTPGGSDTALAFRANTYGYLRLSADGRRAATIVNGLGNALGEMWVLDLEREVMSRLTPAGMAAAAPVWSHDDRRIAFTVEERDQPGGVFVVSAAGTTAPVRLTTAPAGLRHMPASWTPDGRQVLFTSYTTDRNTADVMRVNVESKEVTPILAGPEPEAGPALSPDGRWLAYVGVEAAPQIFLRPYPDVDAERIPVGPGTPPAWSVDGRTLYYRTGAANQLVSVSISTAGNRVTIGRPTPIGDLNNRTVRAIAYPPSSGGRFLVGVPQTSSTTPTEYRVVVNFFEELKARAKATR